MANPNATGKMFIKLHENNKTMKAAEDNSQIGKDKRGGDQTMQIIANVSLNDEEYSTKRSKSKKKMFSTSTSALGKKRPKTASREASLTKNPPPSRQKLQA